MSEIILPGGNQNGHGRRFQDLSRQDKIHVLFDLVMQQQRRQESLAGAISKLVHLSTELAENGPPKNDAGKLDELELAKRVKQRILASQNATQTSRKKGATPAEVQAFTASESTGVRLMLLIENVPLEETA